MASGPTVGEGGAVDGVREKQRYVESKVYTRKAFKGLRKINNNTANSIAELAPATTYAVENKDDNNDKRSKESNTATKVNVNDRSKESTTASNENDNDQSKESTTASNDNDNDRSKESTTATIENANNDSNVNKNVNHDNDNNLGQPLPCTALTEENNLTQEQLISRIEEKNSTQEQQEQLVSRIDAVSDDSSCLNRQQVAAGAAVQSTQDQPSGAAVQTARDQPLGAAVQSAPEQPSGAAVQSTRDQPSGNGVMEMAVENQNNNDLASRTKQDAWELRHKLESELEIVRNVLKRIEEKQGELSEASKFHGSANEGMDKIVGERQMHAEIAVIRVPREPSRPLNQLSISVLENSQNVSDHVEKEKRTPKANQFYRNSEFILGKDKFPPADSNKKAKMNIKKPGGGEIAHGFGLGSKFFKSCSSLLDKLIKHKYGWVFDAPVDVEGLGLHDYHTIIKHPMDLGTVKSRLNKNWYKSPKEFAEDVRLTFLNAMTYNPKGQDVYVMAEQLLTIFEDRWVIIESDYNREMRFGLDYGAALSTPTSRKSRLPPPPPLDMRRILERSESTTYCLDSKNKPLSSTPSGRKPAPKKPKAKDPHKRDMTYEEKQKLSSNLQNLPAEKLDAIVQIIKKRNSELFQHDEEIEVDIDNVDPETLWELDRFVTNYKKSLSKNKRKAELALQPRADDEHNIPQKIQAPVVVEVPEETKAGENAVSSSVPVQGQGNSRSRSSSSSSSSSDSGSSSSDSDSESSSASGSDTGS